MLPSLAFIVIYLVLAFGKANLMEFIFFILINIYLISVLKKSCIKQKNENYKFEYKIIRTLYGLNIFILIFIYLYQFLYF